MQKCLEFIVSKKNLWWESVSGVPICIYQKSNLNRNVLNKKNGRESLLITEGGNGVEETELEARVCLFFIFILDSKACKCLM